MTVYKDYEALRNKAASASKKHVVVAAANDKAVLLTADIAHEKGIADFTLVGDAIKIDKLRRECGINNEFSVIDEPNDIQAALKAAEFVKNGKADVLMKGMINSSIFLKAVLDKEKGLRTGRKLSHLAAFELPWAQKLMFHTDGGMNTYPDLEGKREIITNALEALKKLGIDRPKVAVLAANEVINDKMPSTVDAAKLVEMEKAGELPECDIEGPVALDVAFSQDAAEHKGIRSNISGNVDLYVVPNIDAGNMVGKTLIYCAGAKMAGIILGAKNPIVMTSRAENVQGKLNSILLAVSIA